MRKLPHTDKNVNHKQLLPTYVAQWQVDNTNQQAFKNIDTVMYPYIVFYTRRYLRTTGISHSNEPDMLAEGRFAVLQALGSFDPKNEHKASFITFAVAHIRGRLLKFVSKTKDWETYHDELPIDILVTDSVTPEDDAIRNEDAQSFARELAGLPDIYEQAFLLRAVEGLLFSQIADKMNISRDSASQYYQTVLDLMRKISQQ